MTISLSEPVNEPATEAKTYPDAWVSRFQVCAPAKGVGSVVIELTPYNKERDELRPGPPSEVIALDDLYSALGDPAFTAGQELFQKLLAVVAPLRDWIAARDAAKSKTP